ncbi:MAG: hypothetical protein QOE59_1424, partial [Actinomycetota bacterium]|nr:hypothetical protein [Actinomycetota bacterium]
MGLTFTPTPGWLDHHRHPSTPTFRLPPGTTATRRPRP